MKLIGLMPVRNEEWILGLSARVALMWCDELIIFDHASTDRSLSIEVEVAAEHSGRVTLMGDTDPDWREMTHRQAMLEVARKRGATHIAIVDADEVVTANLVPAMRGLVASLQPRQILQLPLYNLRGSLTRYHRDGTWGRRIVSVGFREMPSCGWTGDRFHAREPFASYYESIGAPHGRGGVLHFWGFDERRLRAKHALYKLTERVRWPEKDVRAIDQMYSMAVHGRPHVSQADTPAGWTFDTVPSTWIEPYLGLFHHCNLTAEPWQEQAVRRMLEISPGLSEGLDLFRVEWKQDA